MNNVYSYELFSAIGESEFTFDWSEYKSDDVVIDLNEELYFVHTPHADRFRYGRNDTKKREIESLVLKAFPEMIKVYNPNANKSYFVIRDMTNNISVEIDLGTNRKKRLAIIGDFHDYDRVKNLNYDAHFTKGPTKENGDIDIRDFTGEEFTLKPNDFIFKVITSKRKDNFLPSPGDFLIDIENDSIKSRYISNRRDVYSDTNQY